MINISLLNGQKYLSKKIFNILITNRSEATNLEINS